MKVFVIDDERTGKIRVRSVNTDSLVREVAEDAAKSKHGRAYIVQHGGTVCNSYGYPAATEAVVVVAIRDESGEVNVAVYATQIRANKATLGGVMSNCLGYAFAPVCDDRFSVTARKAATKALYKKAAEDMLLSSYESLIHA